MREGGKEYIPGIQAGHDTEVGMLGRIAEAEQMTYEEWLERHSHDCKRYARTLEEMNYESMTDLLRQHQPEKSGFVEKTEFIKDLQPALQERLTNEFGQDMRLEYLTAVESRFDYMGVDAVFNLYITKGENEGVYPLLWGVTINDTKKNKSVLTAHVDLLVPSDGWIRPDTRDADYKHQQQDYKQAIDKVSEVLFNEFQKIVSGSTTDREGIITRTEDVRRRAMSSW